MQGVLCTQSIPNPTTAVKPGPLHGNRPACIKTLVLAGKLAQVQGVVILYYRGQILRTVTVTSLVTVKKSRNELDKRLSPLRPFP
jgi:hypothetical protein